MLLTGYCSDVSSNGLTYVPEPFVQHPMLVNLYVCCVCTLHLLASRRYRASHVTKASTELLTKCAAKYPTTRSRSSKLPIRSRCCKHCTLLLRRCLSQLICQSCVSHTCMRR